jgi:hypothetical protein
MRVPLVIAIAVVVLAGVLGAQQTPTGALAFLQRERTASIPTGNTPLVSEADAKRPVPRLPDGRVDLTGPWVGGGSNADIEREGGLKPGELPLLPWARTLRDSRLEQNEPYTICLPMSVPRINPFPWKFGMSYTSRGLTHIYVLHELGDSGAHRVVHMDGRKHPADLLPTWWGHSIGRFEGDTLVIDTVGYNDKFWFDSRGTPHTEQLHTIERWTRVNYGTLVNDFTLDDPGVYSRPVQLKFTARHVRPGLDLMEFICNEDNQYGLAGGFSPAQPDR